LSSYDIDGSSTTKEGQEKQGVRQIIREELRTYLQDPLGFPEEFKGWLPEWITQDGIDIPISQVIGFAQFTAQTNVVPSLAGETTTSTSYTNLATSGPSLTSLPDGEYLLLYGSFCKSSVSGDSTILSPSVNGAAASDDDLAGTQSSVLTSAARATTKSLSNGGNNTLDLKYRVTAGTGTYTHRFLVALKYANL
jgi:hypothetical protein